jgi:hypothetical protein
MIVLIFVQFACHAQTCANTSKHATKIDEDATHLKKRALFSWQTQADRAFLATTKTLEEEQN